LIKKNNMVNENQNNPRRADNDSGGFSSGRGRMKGDALGLGGYCVCSKCGKKIPHRRGVPCYQEKCPECGQLMTRE
jgi:hypothetical protein